MEKIYKLSKIYGLKLLKMPPMQLGGSYKSKLVGNCEFSDIAVFSFHPVKIITSAEGGMALTNDINLASRMERLRSHGITRDQLEMQDTSDGTHGSINS